MDKTLKIHKVDKKTGVKVKETFQTILIGNTEVGKTSIIRRCLYDDFSDVYQKSKSYNLFWTNYEINNELFCLQLWDVSGNEKNVTSVTGNFYKNCNCAFLVYAINDFESLTNLQNWLNDLRKFANNDILTILVGNKIDLKTERLISYENGKKFQEENKIDYFTEISAKTGEKIEDLVYNTIITLYCQIKYSTKIYEKLNEINERNSTLSINLRPSTSDISSYLDARISKNSINYDINKTNFYEEFDTDIPKKKRKKKCCWFLCC
jgi:Ras-related protein Rab-1A